MFLLFCGFVVIPWPFLGSGGVWKWSWATGLRPVLIWAPTEPYGPILHQISCFFGQQISDYQKSKLFLKSKSPHLAILINIWHIWKIDLEKLMTNPIWDFFTETIDLLSARPFENLVWRGGYGFYLFPKMVGTKILVPRSWYQDLGTSWKIIFLWGA